jgi:site-specific recombinase XerD
MAELCEERSESGRKYATGTIHNRLKAARKFFGYLVQTEKRRTNPFEDVEYPRMEEHLSRNGLTEAQMGRLLGDLGRFDEPVDVRSRQRAYRVHVLAEFLYATGLRIDEASRVREEDVDLEQHLVHVKQGKGGRPRTAFLNGYAAQVLGRYMRAGRAAVLRRGMDEELLFCACTRELMALLARELQSRCTTLELPVITSHGFRHSLGTHLLRAGCDMRHIQVILGHESLATTQIYTKVDKEDLKKSLDEFHPRRWNPRSLQGGDDER